MDSPAACATPTAEEFNQPFYGSLDFVWNYLGEPLPEK